MKIINCDQRGSDWFTARLGKPTASSMCEIVTRTGKLRTGAAPRRYMLELLGERLTGYPTQHFETEAMRRGVELEPRAIAYYEMVNGAEVEQVGFALDDSLRFGCSPDGMVGDDGGVEVKCPMQAGFLDVATTGVLPDDHYIQVQSTLLITGRAWWDYVLFTDARGLAPQVIRVLPAIAFHRKLRTALTTFCDELDALESNMRAAGHGYTEPKKEITQDEYAGCPFGE